jgi:hypothetical protein
MAVVQISKIQVRRGQKFSNTGVPQLSSGEFAWAVDSQELFIGNGSIAEGAPYVGNTKILTEHDNIIELLGAYQYAADNPEIVGTVPRSLQSKLDEVQVSVVDFGATGNGFTDDTSAFQTALNQLFLNDKIDYKKKLVVPPGNYKLSDLTIPSRTTIEGESEEECILNFGSSKVTFLTENGDSVLDFESGNVPRHVSIINITLSFASALETIDAGQLDITGLVDSKFIKTTIIGQYPTTTSIGFNDLLDCAPTVVWNNALPGTSVNRISFTDCKFDSLPVVFECSQNLAFETDLFFNDCVFNSCGIVTKINADNGAFLDWTYQNCRFVDITREVFLAPSGDGVKFNQSKFKNCGNNLTSADTPATFIIELGDAPTAVINNCSFDRPQAASVTNSFETPGISEVRGAGQVVISDKIHADIFLSDAQRPLAAFSAYNSTTTIDYNLSLGNSVRTGVLTISINKDRSEFSIVDNYQVVSDDDSVEDLAFSGTMFSNLPGYLTDSTNDTFILTYENPSVNNKTGTILYNYSYSV